MSLVRGGEYETVDMQVGATATGNGTAATPFSVTRGSYNLLTAQVTGISGDTITWEGTIDETNWAAIPAFNLADQTTATTATANGIYRIVVTGLRGVRARVSAWVAGTITVKGVLSSTGELGSRGGGGVTDHGALSGLADDDHPQYLLTSSAGSAAYLNVGTSANNVVQLNGSAQLPAVDGSLLTGISGGSGSPGGGTTQVQYNNAGAFAGDAGMTYDAATDKLTLVGGLNVTASNPSTGKIYFGTGNSNTVPAIRFDASAPAGTTAIFINNDIFRLQSYFNTIYCDIGNDQINLVGSNPIYRINNRNVFRELTSSALQIGATYRDLYMDPTGGTSPQRVRLFGGSNAANITAEFASDGLHNIYTPDAGTANIPATLTIDHRSTSTPATGFGVSLVARLESSTTESQSAGRLTYEWVTATHASRASRGKLSAYYTSTEQTAMTWDGDTGGLKLGFYGVTPVARQVLATGAGATVDNVITALQALGLVKQS